MATTVDELLLQLKVDLNGLNAGLSTGEKKIETFSNKVEKQFTRLGYAIAGAFTLQLVKNVAEAADSMVRLEARLNATTGSAENAAEAMTFLKDAANKQSIDLISLADGYTRLLPAVNAGAISMEEMRRILTLANDNIKAFGLGTEEAKGLFLGLSQALGSGTVTMEDLRQVTDRLPGSLSALADANNMTVGAFKDLIATGNVTADMIKGGLIEAFEANEGAAEKMAGTLESATARMMNALRELAAQIGESGLNDAMVGLADSVTTVSKAVTEFLKAMQYGGFALGEWANGTNDAAWETEQFTKQLERAKKEARELAEAQVMGVETENIPTPVMKPEKEQEKAIDRYEKEAERLAKEAEQRQEALDKELEQLRDSLKSKEELEDESHIERLEKIAQFQEMGMLTEAEYNAMSEAEQIRHMDALKEIRKAGLTDLEKFNQLSYSKQAKQVFGELANITAGVAQHNRALFEANKIAGIADAIINGYVGVSKTLAAYPFPINVGMAAAHAAVAFAQVNAIRSSSFSGGGGGSAPSLAGSTPATPVSPVSGGNQGSSNGLDVTLTPFNMNDLFTGAQVNSLIAKINEAVEDGAIIRSVRVS